MIAAAAARRPYLNLPPAAINYLHLSLEIDQYGSELSANSLQQQQQQQQTSTSLPPPSRDISSRQLNNTTMVRPSLLAITIQSLAIFASWSQHINMIAEVSSFRIVPQRAILRTNPYGVRNQRLSTSHRAKQSFSTIRTSTFTKTSLRSTRSSSNSSNDDDFMEEKETTPTSKAVTPETIAEMIEVSFIQSCLQLSQGYIDVLKLFIVAVKIGYEQSLSLHELHTLVTNCSVNSAGRELMTEEKDLRYEWMKMVYELLNALNRNNSDDTFDGSVQDSASDGSTNGEKKKNANTRISGVVQSMLSIQRILLDEESNSGGKQDAIFRMTKLTVEQALAQSQTLSVLYETTSNNPMERAILTNDIRVAILTFRVLEEERVCLQDKVTDDSVASDDGMKERVPRPPIPGT